MPAVSGDSAARAALGWNFPEADFLIPVAQITALYECRVLRPKPRTSVNARRQGRSKLHDSGSLQCPCGRPATRVGAGSWRSARPVSQAALDERRPLKFEHLGVLWKELSVERLGGRKLALFLHQTAGGDTGLRKKGGPHLPARTAHRVQRRERACPPVLFGQPVRLDEPRGYEFLLDLVINGLRHCVNPHHRCRSI